MSGAKTADDKQLRMAVAQLRDLRSHVHTPINQATTDEYQSVIEYLEDAAGEFLQHFSMTHKS
jgi:hypothetical protein